MCVCVCVCVFVFGCVCVCVCYGEVAASISSLANWCMVLCIYIYICKCTNVVWGCRIHPAQLQALRVIDLCFLVSAFSAAVPSDRLAAVRIEGMKGEVTVMSKAACFSLSQLTISTSAGRLWLRSGVRSLPDSTLTPRWKNSTYTLTQMIVASEDTCFTGQGGGGRRLTNHLYFVLKLTMILFFHTANQTL